MKQFRVLRQILKHTRADKIWTGFLLVFFLSAVIMWLLEPGIPSLGKALWYCYAVVTTIGFGDVVVQSPVSRILSVLLSVYAAVVIALITGVIVNYYNQLLALRQKDTIIALFDKLERLPELSKEELEQISRRVKEYR